MKENQNIKLNTHNEVETALAKLLFYIHISLIYEPYKKYTKELNGLLDITKKWIIYYAKDRCLQKLSDEEVIEGQRLLDSIPFEAYEGLYYENNNLQNQY